MTVTLYCGDCLDILPTLSGPFDAIITDLPYGTTACKWDVVIPFAPMWAQVKRLLKPRGAFVTTASQPFTSALIMSNLAWFRHEWIWEKDNGSNAAQAQNGPMRYHENILVFSLDTVDYNPQMWDAGMPSHRRGKKPRALVVGREKNYCGEQENTNLRYPKSIIRVARPKHNNGGLHPTQKPVALYEYLIRTYTNTGDTVLDFCMGSGTTGVAAVQAGRNFVGIELDPGYFAIAERRIAAAQAQGVLL